MIEPRYGVLQTLFADRVFRIPHYQRFYSWKKEQREDLFNDLRKLATGGEDQHHFMATIVCHKTKETKHVGAAQYRIYDVVDGQQRLTSLILLLKTIELALPDKSESRVELANVLVKRDGHLILLQTNNANEFNFNRFIREGVGPSAGEIETHSDQNLANAIRECRQFVSEWKQSSDAVLGLMRLILHRLGFVVFDTEDSRVVYTVFEVLNSRGLAVDWLDKTKSVLMGRMYELSESDSATEAEIKALQEIWGKIYRELARENVPGEEILRVTATLYYGPGQGKPRSAEESLFLLKKRCNSFDQPRRISMRLLDVARKISDLYNRADLKPVTHILHARILAVAIKSASGINDSEILKLLEQWERVTFRIFGLSNNDSRTKVGDYVRLAAKIVSDDLEFRTYNQIMQGLRDLGEGYPVQRAVTEALAGKNFYVNPDRCRYVLWSYEESLAKNENAAIATTDRDALWRLKAMDSIEHIFPQNPSGTAWNGKMQSSDGSQQRPTPNVDRIGNLVLLPIQLNREAQNHSFESKKKTYSKYSLRSLQEICREDDWTLARIEAREQRILNWAITRWSDI